MKKFNKLMSVFLALVLLLSFFPSLTFKASAAEAGTLPSNAIPLQDGVWHTKYWTSTNDELNCFNKIVVPQRGYITFVATKPFDDEGEMCSYDLILYSSNGDVVWAADAEKQCDSFSEYYTYMIGLQAGTYIMNLDPNFYVYSSSAPIKAQYKYTFTQSSNWEIENNNNKSLATAIALNQTYYGVYTEESYDITYKDYYKVKLTKGADYTVCVGNYSGLEAGTTIIEMHDPSGTDILPYQYTESGNSAIWNITASYSGWYYIVFHNDGNEAGVAYSLKVATKPKSINTLNISLSKTSYAYDGTVKTPKVIVKDASGRVLKSGTDYTVTYSSGRTKIGTYKVVVTAKGGYSGKKTLSFKIVPANISTCKVALSATSYSYTGKTVTPRVVIKNAAGKILEKDVDYTVSYASGRKKVGTYKVTVKMKGNYTGTKTLTFKIVPANISTCSIELSKTAYTYNGKTVTPTVIVKNAAGTTLKKNTHYTVSYSSGRKNVGTYKVTIKMKGSYTGKKTLTFKILPPKTAIKSVTSLDDALKVTVTKKAKQVTGYQVQFSTAKNFANAVTKAIKSYKTTSLTLNDLMSATNYYVRVRTYKTVKGVKYYSGWSVCKIAKTK